MAITTRAGKNSALTHAELDANFTTLGLAHGDANAELDVSKMIINATEIGSDPRLQAEGNQYDSIHFLRTGQTGTAARTSVLYKTQYTDGGHASGQGTGYWTQIETTDGIAHAGAVLSRFDNVTDANNYTSSLNFQPVTNNGGSLSFATAFKVTHNEIEMFAPLKVAEYTNTEIGSLSANTASIIFNTDTSEFQGWNGTSWVVLG